MGSAALEAKLPRLDYAPVAFELEDRTLIPHGIAYDAASRSLFMGSIAQHKVLRIAETGAVNEFVTGADLDAVLGIAVDSPRRILYVASTSALTADGEQRRRNAVLAFDIDSRRLLQRYDLPGALQLDSVNVGFAGRVFASDAGSGAVYELAVKGPGPARVLVSPGMLRASKGLAASPDATRLYVAHAGGLALVDTRLAAWKMVANETREDLVAIEGLYPYQGELIAVQNTPRGGRVIRLQLSRDGGSVTHVKTLLSHHHNKLEQPSTGAIGDRGFYLLAATGRSHYTRAGTIEHPESVPNPTILRLLLPH